jgi:Domain of unknown function (DUF4258)
MFRKYLPLIVLVLAVLCYFWIKKNQQGKSSGSKTRIEIPAADVTFNREYKRIKYSSHARCRMDCRKIDEGEVKDILKNGRLNVDRIEEDEKGRTYPLEGITRDLQHVRIVFAPHDDELVVVTVIDLEKEWPCNCN